MPHVCFQHMITPSVIPTGHLLLVYGRTPPARLTRSGLGQIEQQGFGPILRVELDRIPLRHGGPVPGL